MAETVTFSITLSPWISQYREALSGHLADMRHTLRALDDDSFRERATDSPKNRIQFIHSTADVTQGALHRATSRCFLAAMTNLFALIDRTIAAARLLDDGLAVPTDVLADREATTQAITEALAAGYETISTDTRLRGPMKIAYLKERVGLSDDAARLIGSYLAARRALEHHGGVARKTLTIFFREPKLFFSKESRLREIAEMPAIGEEGESVVLSIVEERKTYAAGAPITFLESDIERMTTCMSLLAMELEAGWSQRAVVIRPALI